MPSRTFALVVLLGLALPASAHDGGSDAQSPLLEHGASYTETAHAAGTYAYHCHVHPGMQGTLVVLPDADPRGPQVHRVNITDDGFRDAATGTNATTVRLGDHVAWTNQGVMAHDVHLTWPAPADNGSFELWVVGGLVAALLGITWAARRL